MSKKNNTEAHNACDYIFPAPLKCDLKKEKLVLDHDLSIAVEGVRSNVLGEVKNIVGNCGLSFSTRGGTLLRCIVSSDCFSEIEDEAIRSQAYDLKLDSAGIRLQAMGMPGIRHGITTLAEIFAAAAKGAELTCCEIVDYPALSVRGVQIDLAREFFPPMEYLKKIVDRLVAMKCDTLWLYFENRFHAAGMEDVSPANGLTPSKALEISDYAAERGVDVVPGINVLSHMEGWFRLQRNSGFCDGRMRSHPVLTDPRSLEMVLKYLDAVMEAFPSENFHAGLDELLFTGTNPEAEEAIAKQGKAAYFANFAEKVIEHIQKKGKRVWMWDDMVLGKNVNRPEGFNEDYKQALKRIPKDVVMTHWYYWTNEDGKHGEIIKRVGESGRPFVVAPGALGTRSDYANFNTTLELQAYMTECGVKYGAFGLVNTHWESRLGHFFEPHWPHLAVAAGFAWNGRDVSSDKNFPNAFSFNVARDVDSHLVDFLNLMAEMEELLTSKGIGRGKIRNDLYLRGAHFLWRCGSPALSKSDRAEIRRLLEGAAAHISCFDDSRENFKTALRAQTNFFSEVLNLIDAFDRAYDMYHKASLAQMENPEKFEISLKKSVDYFGEVLKSVDGIIEITRFMSSEFGHTPYDVYALREHRGELAKVPDLILKCVEKNISLPYFEKLLYLPDSYHISNIRQLEVQNTFHNPFAGRDCAWLHSNFESKSTHNPNGD